MRNIDYLIVGAGFAGSVSARILADAGYQVVVIDKRHHVGGNAYDHYDVNGILIHPYGPHIFHTNSKKVFKFLSRFTDWRFYEHRVLASIKGELYPIPINQKTINKVFNLNLLEHEIEDFLQTKRVPKATIKTSEDVVLSSVGEELCNMFFRGYTKKQWGLDLAELSAGVAARIPTRTNDDDRYFTDVYQFMPHLGYGVLFDKLLDSPNITVQLGCDFFEKRGDFNFGKLIYTGPIDAYFGYCYGKLPYRSLRFEHEYLNTNEYQSVGTVNYPNEYAYTRITEFKHLTGQNIDGTSIVREYPCDVGDPYYPVPTFDNELLFKRYQALVDLEENTYFVGRLAQYRYYNMDQVVAAAMHLCEKLV